MCQNIPKDRLAKQMMEDLTLIDIWRLIILEKILHSTHKLHSQIDYFLISNNLVENVSECTIGPIL